MTERLEVYKCMSCGNIVEMMVAGAGELVCCGAPMKLLKENTTDAANEKHVPVLERGADGQVTVSVGSVAHPMEDKHYIQWIEVICPEHGLVERKYLNPGDAPKATFTVAPACAGKVYAREHCNLHGHWKGE